MGNACLIVAFQAVAVQEIYFMSVFMQHPPVEALAFFGEMRLLGVIIEGQVRWSGMVFFWSDTSSLTWIATVSFVSKFFLAENRLFFKVFFYHSRIE